MRPSAPGAPKKAPGKRTRDRYAGRVRKGAIVLKCCPLHTMTRYITALEGREQCRDRKYVLLANDLTCEERLLPLRGDATSTIALLTLLALFMHLTSHDNP